MLDGRAQSLSATAPIDIHISSTSNSPAVSYPQSPTTPSSSSSNNLPPLQEESQSDPVLAVFSISPADRRFLQFDACSSRTSSSLQGEVRRTTAPENGWEPSQPRVALEKDTKANSGSFMELQTIHPVIKSFLIGSVSGTCSTVLFQPLDLLKTRLQALPPPPPFRHGVTPVPVTSSVGMVSLVGHILRHENVGSLWRGMTPSLTRCVPGVGLYFASIHALKSTFSIGGEPTAVESVLLGVTGRSFSGVMMIPFTVIKTRFESRVYQYSSIREAWRVIYRQEGVRGLTCGLIPTLLRDAPFSGIYLMMYTSTKKAVGKEWLESSPTLGPYVRFSCGIVAGIGASLVTQPFDVIKTKMQLYPDKFSSVREAIPYVYKKYGVQGYFKGLMPRMIRRTLIAAMSWTLYEQLVQSMGLK